MTDIDQPADQSPGDLPDDSGRAAIEDAADDAAPLVTPVVAVVGRPNVGKSTLVNRILGRREAVVQDVPGVTRDRIAYDAYWGGRQFTLVDTGGWEPDATGLQAMVSRQAEQAVVTADLVLFVIDSRTGATDTDLTVARTLRRAGRPVVLAVTKVDDERGESDAAEAWSLGLGEPYAVSGLHGRGSGDLLDAILAKLPDAPPEREPAGGPRRVALVGRPNVGKSSLLNRLTGEERSVVDSVAGTTVDPVDSMLQLGGEIWRFVDTAGLRRRVNNASGMEYYASLRTASAIEAAEVAVVLLDASEVLSEQDQRVISMVIDSGRALVIALNKWDLVDEDRRLQLEREVDWELQRVQWAPRVNVSAKTGRAVDKLAGALRKSLSSWDRRIPTGRLNSWLTEVVNATPPPGRGGRHPRVLFGTQADTRPPRFVLFTTGFLESGYRRFLERKLREDFDFEGSPIEISVRVREREKRP
ncbi:ribosome biogenesis GTPase Der [Jatrophihabitans lederbergiae]|uniref:GTPase Der n=1 Tax=Jatrophihabitans lederbergiae TaxID=3075547 RepID=A0ABU2JCT7_9ACTN|nr:ribosome biogenesis GTPase Der [Jatrophihabitans sp. DSM 44399]MDT0262796.1 ribosome biogenesis GTPase Der [Jatrophihabitans sp. DSM 44399]